MLQFAKRLVSKGHKATLAPTISITKSVGIEPISDGFDEHGFEEAGSIENYLEHLEAVGSRTLAELIDNQNTSGNTIDCLLYDAFLPWALDVANKLSLYAAAFFTQSCVVDAIYYHVYKGKVTVPSETDAISWSGLPQLQICDLPSPVSVPVAYPGFIKLLLSQFSNLDKADCVLLNTFDEVESEVLRYMKEIWPLKTVGPTIPSKYLDRCVEGDTDYGFILCDQNAAICKKWLDEKPIGSVVYASFGSISVVGEEQMEELAWGLKRSNHNFLWVVRESEEKKLPTKFKDEIKGKGLIVTWCPPISWVFCNTLWLELYSEGIVFGCANGGTPTLDRPTYQC